MSIMKNTSLQRHTLQFSEAYLVGFALLPYYRLFSTILKICDGAFLWKQLTAKSRDSFLKKTPPQMFGKVKHAIDSLITLLVNSIVADHDFFFEPLQKKADSSLDTDQSGYLQPVTAIGGVNAQNYASIDDTVSVLA